MTTRAQVESGTHTAPPEHRIDAVVFDLGGVLLDVDFNRTLACWRRLGASVPDTPPPPDEAYRRFERGEIDFPRYAASLRDRHGLALGDDALLEGWNAAIGDPLPGAVALVEAAARSWPVFVFSNTNAAHEDAWRSRADPLLSPLMDVFTSHRLGVRKPEAASFRQVVDRIAVPAARIVFLDDLAANVTAARAAGLTAHQVLGPQAAHEVLARYRC